MRVWMAFLVLSIITLLWIATESSAGPATTYIVDDDNGTWADYGTIQEAIDHGASGARIEVYEGVYNETVLLNRTFELFGNGTNVTVIDGGNNGTVLDVTVDSCFITGLKLQGPKSDRSVIDLTGENVTIEDCLVGDPTDPESEGIYMIDAHNATVRDCLITDRFYGIFMDDSNDVLVEGCNSSFNRYGVVADGANVTVRENVFRNDTTYGVLVYFHSRDVIVENNTIVYCDVGLQGYYCNNSTFANNSIIDSIYEGMSLVTCDNITISRNNVSGAGDPCIYIETTSIVEISNNSLSHSDEEGIYVLGSPAEYIEICYNDIFFNGNYGVYLNSAARCIIWHNNFWRNGNNSSQGYDDQTALGSENDWDNGWGNYWSDHDNSSRYDIDGMAGARDTVPQNEPYDNDSPQSIPEFGTLHAIAVLFIAMFAVGRKRRFR